MNAKSIPTMILSAFVAIVMVATLQVVAPRAAYAEGGDPPLDTPTGLKWGSTYIDTMALWDWLAPGSDPDGKYKDIGHYAGTVTCEHVDGTTTTNNWQTSEPTDGHDFEEFIKANGGGKYSFTVQAIAKSGSGKNDSGVATSGEQGFNILSIDWKTLKEDGSEAEDKNDGYGQIFLEDSSGGHQASSKPYLIAKQNEAMKLTISGEVGYTVESIDFEESEPSDLKVDGKYSTFSLDKDYTVTVVFKKDNSTTNVQLDFGEKHGDLAATVAQTIKEDGEYEAEVDGTVLTVKGYPKASSYASDFAGDLGEYLSDALFQPVCRINYKSIVQIILICRILGAEKYTTTTSEGYI